MKVKDLAGTLKTYGMKFNNCKKKSIVLNTSHNRSKPKEESNMKVMMKMKMLHFLVKDFLNNLKSTELRIIKGKRPLIKIKEN